MVVLAATFWLLAALAPCQSAWLFQACPLQESEYVLVKVRPLWKSQCQVTTRESDAPAAAGWAMLLAQGSQDVYKAQVNIAENTSKIALSDAGSTCFQSQPHHAYGMHTTSKHTVECK